MSQPLIPSDNPKSQSWRERLIAQLTLPRAADVTPMQAGLGFLARFYDELVGGLPDVLMPTIQAQLDLSLTQVGMLRQVLDYVGAGVEPINGLLIDIWRRKWLMGFGAASLGLAIMTIGTAPTFFWLILGYVLFGLSSGPLAHTGDVVVVESYPTAPDRAYTRSTLIDTTGALLAPLLVTFFVWQGWSWRWLMVGMGVVGILYVSLIFKHGLPLPKQAHSQPEEGLLSTLRNNISDVLHDNIAMRWLLLLFLFNVLELPAILKTIWLAQQVGMSQTLIGLYIAAEMVVSLISLMVLDFLRHHVSIHSVLKMVAVSVTLLYPLWLLTPGLWPRFVLMVPLTFFFTMFWPILKANSLASLPGRAGAITAIRSVMGILPLPLLFGVLADRVGLTGAMLGIHMAAIVLITGVIFFAYPSKERNLS